MTDSNGMNQGVEEFEHPLQRTIKNVLNEAEEPPGGYSVIVSCDLLRDVMPRTSVTQNQIRRAADQYLAILNDALQSGETPGDWQTQLECGISIHFYPAQIPGASKFKLDQVDASAALGGGYVVSDSINNINRCVAEKTEKIKDKIHLYTEWWLVLVDHNVYTPMSNEADELNIIRNNLQNTENWSRIVVLNWNFPEKHVDLL